MVQSKDVARGMEAVLKCSITSNLPSWKGPPSLKRYSYQDSQNIDQSLDNADRLSVSANGDLVIANAQLQDTGSYSCSYAGESVEEMYLTVWGK